MTKPSEAPEGPAILTQFEALAFFPADFAAVESGKIYTGGGFWANLNFPTFPAVLAAMTLVAVIKVPFHANQADHTINMGLVDADDKALGFEVQGVFRSAPRIDSPYGEPGVAPVAVPVQGLTFERPGKYNFTLKVDNREIGRYGFRVSQVASVMMQPSMPKPPVE
jgi:hypothetical protein